ncbi:MAG: hypothetical protein RIG77_00930 [Cyclobacteriaceae bacterium]
MLKEQGFNVKVMSFEREYHKGRLPNCNIESLGKIHNGQYFLRFFRIVKALPKIRSSIKKFDVVYAFGPDMAAAAFVAAIGIKRPVIMEIGDITSLQLSKKVVGFLVRKLESVLVNRLKLLVVISSGFLAEYYRTRLKVKTDAMLIENKLERTFGMKSKLDDFDGRNIIVHQNSKKRMRIGYFGLLRDEWSWLVLKELCVRYPETYEVVFAGRPVSPKNLEEQVSKLDNMRFLGEYSSPKDLPKLYNQVDMIWACYSSIGPNDWNLRWGRPNRFFEGCYYNRPVFAREGASFAEDVKRYTIGKVIRHTDIEQVIDEICSISEADYLAWKDNLSSLPEKVYIYTSEAEELSKKIRNMVILSNKS